MQRSKELITNNQVTIVTHNWTLKKNKLTLRDRNITIS